MNRTIWKTQVPCKTMTEHQIFKKEENKKSLNFAYFLDDKIKSSRKQVQIVKNGPTGIQNLTFLKKVRIQKARLNGENLDCVVNWAYRDSNPDPPVSHSQKLPKPDALSRLCYRPEC